MTGIEALQSIEQHPHVDMVVSDINMPRMDGLSLLAKLQEAEDKKSTIIVSAYGDMSNIRTAMNRGAFDFLTKPIDFGDLETDDRQDHPPCRDDARGAPPPGRGRARACLAVALFLAADRRAGWPRDGESDGMEVHRREVATIFTDITGFTSLVETAAPEVLGALLNEYVGGMTDVVFAHEGTVAKIIGDAIQVLFNAPGDQPDYATRAVACAHDLDAWARGISRRAGRPRASISAPPASAFMPVRRWSAISAAAASSTTPPMATPSTPRRGLRPPTSFSARAFASAPRWPKAPSISAAGRSAISMLRGRSEPLRAYEPLPAAAFDGAGDDAIFRSLCQARSRRCRGDAGLCGAGREHADDRARRLSFEAAAQRRQGRPHATGITRSRRSRHDE